MKRYQTEATVSGYNRMVKCIKASLAARAEAFLYFLGTSAKFN